MISVRNGENINIVPCGKCAFCLTNRRSQWMFRIHQEMKTQEHPGFFLTLTYDEKHVKRTPAGLSLRFRDVQLFMKQLRKADYYVKYICVGEYGGVTKRPHYHLLIWTDAPVHQLESIWHRGQIHFGQLTMASAMYTLKYIIQPKQLAVDGLEPTRAQFSRGLGLLYLSSAVYHYHTADEDNPVLTSRIDGRLVALPQYYRRKIFTKYQLRRVAHAMKWEMIRTHRREMRVLLKKGLTNVNSYMQRLRCDEAQRIIQTTKFNQTL